MYDSLQNNRRTSKDRRDMSNRRTYQERRGDFRDGAQRHGRMRSIWVWVHSITVKSRIGVDRRKDDRRITDRRLRRAATSLLTKDEISDLLA